MSGAEVLDIGPSAIWLTLQLCAPVLIVGLLVGVAKVIGFLTRRKKAARRPFRPATAR